jgi:hypothetical protein
LRAGFVTKRLLDLSRALLTIPFPGEGFLGPAFLAGLQVEGMPFDFLNDVFLLHFTLESPQSAFKRLAILKMDFCQSIHLPSP